VADTIYFGGGTPSLLEPSEIAAIIEACRGAFDVTADAEITMEANPETVTPERLEGFRDAGVTRLSYGVQSFRDEELQRLSRLHSASRAGDAFAMARAAGFDNISLDLMMWLPQPRVPLHSGALPERAAPRGDGALEMVAGARRRCGGDVPGGDAAARRRWLRAVRDFQRRAARARVTPQPEILD
jgi:hypothetical protein